MKNLKKWLVLPLIVMLFVPVMIFSACGKNDNGDPNAKFYEITISKELPQGVSLVNLPNNVKEGEDLEFSILLQQNYNIGTLKVLGNGIELQSFKSEDADNGKRYFYRVSNVGKDIAITFAGATEETGYKISGIWVDNFGGSKTDDKNINDFFVDVNMMSGNGDSATSNDLNFDSMADFKQYIKSKTFNHSIADNEVITFCVYSKDNCESFVDGWIYCNDNPVVPETNVETENVDGKEVKYLKAKYILNMTDNTNLYFYEEAVVRSGEIPVSVCVVDDIETNNNFSPRIVLKDESGLAITNYSLLNNAKIVNVYIENIYNVWKPIFDNPNLEYSLSHLDIKYVFKPGEYVSDSGNYIFENVGLPYNRGDFANYTLYITNAKELIQSDSNYSKISITTENIARYTLSESNCININGVGEYWYSKCENYILVNIKKNFTQIQIEFSNDAGETKTITLSLTNKKQDITDGYTFSRYRLEENYNIYEISYDGTGALYNNIKLTAL